jgi:hypothetical protein
MPRPYAVRLPPWVGEPISEADAEVQELPGREPYWTEEEFWAAVTPPEEVTMQAGQTSSKNTSIIWASPADYARYQESLEGGPAVILGSDAYGYQTARVADFEVGDPGDETLKEAA